MFEGKREHCMRFEKSPRLSPDQDINLSIDQRVKMVVFASIIDYFSQSVLFICRHFSHICVCFMSVMCYFESRYCTCTLRKRLLNTD